MREPIQIPPYSTFDHLFHVLSAAANAALTLWGGYWLLGHLGNEPGSVFGLATGVVLGYFLADLFSGFLHWTFDTWFDEDVRSVRRMVLIVREHHVRPQNIFNYGFLDEVGALSWASLLLTAPAYGFVALAEGLSPAIGCAVVGMCIVLSVCTVWSLQFHKLGHRRASSAVTQALQHWRVLISPWHHQVHHRGAHDVRYCLINGWADWVMDGVGGWRALESLVSRLTGSEPRARRSLLEAESRTGS